MSPENEPGFIYQGRGKGYRKAEPEFESKAVDNRPSFPGVDVMHLKSAETGIDDKPMFSAIIARKGEGGELIIVSRDSKTNNFDVENFSHIVKKAIENADPANPEGYEKPEPKKAEIRPLVSNRNGVIFEVGRKPKKIAS